MLVKTVGEFEKQAEKIGIRHKNNRGFLKRHR